MKCFLKYLLVLLLLNATGPHLFAQATEKPNIIFIVVDDLNDYIDELGGSPEVETPNIDRITATGTLFTNAECSSPLCCPSRTSFLTGKDASYTHIYSAAGYKCSDFSQNFTAAKGNDEYYTIPGYLKDSIGYYTYGLNKIFHCYENYQEWDSITPDPCAKGLSWNKIFVYNDSSTIAPGVTDEGVHNNEWAAISDTMEKYLMDYVAVDSATKFIHQFASGEDITCGDPFFIALGIKKPHKPLYIPEKYFKEEYVEDFYATPYNIPYNFPHNAFPLNGIIMPPQPEIPFSDYYSLPTDSMGQGMVAGADNNFVNWAEDLSPLPVVNPSFDDSLTRDVLAWSKRANCVMAYLAAIKYLDAQLGRLLDSLESYPDVYNNTVIILLGDNGFSMSEKKHWGKRTMWETDVRIPLVISDLRAPEQQVCNATVNLLDLFPTICDIIDVPYPTFSNGAHYLDGKSLTELLSNPAEEWERPLLSCVKKEGGTEGSCFPQYSIRNDRFHYIRYQSNGGGLDICDSTNSYYEAELYEIGMNREVDPNEWNNLIKDPDYKPVVDYLQQWLPDSSYFLQKTFKAIIHGDADACLLNHNDTIHLSFDLFDTTGTLITPPSGYIYEWTNNLTGAVIDGTSGEFYLSSIPDAAYEANENLKIYLSMIDTAHHATAAFDLKDYFINTDNTPVASYDLIAVGLTINIADFNIEGSYNNYWWVINGDSLFLNDTPGPYTVTSPGTYTVTCYVEYGNTGCVQAFTQTITTSIYNYFKDDILFVAPNPAHDQVIAYLKSGFQAGSIELFDLNGQLVKFYDLSGNTGNYYTFDVNDITPGLYILNYLSAGRKSTSPLVIMH